jgi:hypothetical protein
MEKHFFNKLLFFTMVHKLKGAPDETRKQLAERTEQTFIEREMKIMDIKKYEGFKEEHFLMQNQIAELKSENQVSHFYNLINLVSQNQCLKIRRQNY